MPDTNLAPTRWSPQAATPPAWNRPGAAVAMLRGLVGRCPSCGQSRLFTGWLKQATMCPHCAAPIGRVRADDAPPYIVIFVFGHLVIAMQFALDDKMGLSVLAELAIFLPITAVASLALLRPVKGAMLGLMLQLGMVSSPDG